jgi:flavin reductase (DIM6/NTAB) family NADH-FMN oxidoreductase RutF
MSVRADPDEPPRRLTPEEFRDVIGHFASGVTVVTTTAGGTPAGTTASAVTSLSLEPPMVLVCLSQSSATGQAIASSGSFAVNILGEEHGELAVRFARKGGDKFDGVALRRGHYAGPLLDDAIAHLECRVAEQVAAGTHVVFIADVLDGTARSGEPLAYFRGRFGRLDRTLGGDEREAVVKEPAPAAGPDADVPLARRAIELGVVELTIGHADGEQVAALRRLMEATAELLDGEHAADAERWHAADAAFHEHIVALAGSESLLATYRGLAARSLPAAAAATEQSQVDDHRRIVEAYEHEDLELARRTLAAHHGLPRART